MVLHHQGWSWMGQMDSKVIDSIRLAEMFVCLYNLENILPVCKRTQASGMHQMGESRH